MLGAWNLLKKHFHITNTQSHDFGVTVIRHQNADAIVLVSALIRDIHPLILERLRYPGSVLRVRVSPFCLPIFADVSIFTRNFYPFPRGKPWSTRKRQTGTGVFYLLFVGGLNSKNFQHLTQINNALMLVNVFNNL